MATPRTTQAHEKRVQQIAAEAAAKIAADSPLEEEVVVVVEELPPGEPAPTRSGRMARAEHNAENTVLGMVAQGQRLMAGGMSRWIGITEALFWARIEAMETFGTVLDPLHVTREAFRLAEELLASQKELALKVAEAMVQARAA